MLTLNRPPSSVRPTRPAPWWRRIAIALTALVLLLTGTPAAAEPTDQYGYHLIPTYWGTSKLGYVIKQYRANHPEVSGRSDVAAFELKLPDGTVVHVAAASVSTVPGKTDGVVEVTVNGKVQSSTVKNMANKHAEEVVHAYLSQQKLPSGGTQADEVTEGESELKPCLQVGHLCRARLKDQLFPKLKVMRYAIAYDDPGVDNEKQVNSLDRTVRRWFRTGHPMDALFGDDLMSPPGTAPPDGGLADALAGVPGSPNGGIDFSSLELRYLADAPPGGDQGIRFAFSAPAANQPPRLDAGRAVTLQASDAFFVWLSLSPAQFWVNLNPDEPSRIIDAKLGTTDVGRVMLLADLQMKKTVAKFIHPDTPLGKQLWDSLDAGGKDETCLSFRQWIVPAPATVREDQDALYILDAPLSVELESDYVAQNGGSAYSCSGQSKATQAHNEQVFRSMILPKIRDAVNHAPEYADLRRIYLSRVAAEWYRKREMKRHTMFGDLIGSGDVSYWPARQRWKPKDVFDQYVKSYTNGEFNVTHTTQQGNTVLTYTYVYGGVDFGDVRYGNLDPAAFTSKYGALPGAVQQALQKPSPDQNGLVWFGSTTERRPIAKDRPRVDNRPLATLAIGLVVCVLLVVVVVAVVLFVVLRSTGRKRAPVGSR